MKIFKELEQFNWINPTKEELDNMIEHINCIDEKLTEEQEKELYNYLNELEDMKKQQEQEIDEELEYYDNNKDRLYYGVE